MAQATPTQMSTGMVRRTTPSHGKLPASGGIPWTMSDSEETSGMVNDASNEAIRTCLGGSVTVPGNAMIHTPTQGADPMLNANAKLSFSQPHSNAEIPIAPMIRN